MKIHKKEYNINYERGNSMLDQKVADLLNEQINKELYSAYLYLDFANYYAHKGLNGYANWYNIQVKEEVDHATGIIQYLQDNDYAITLSTIEKPNIEIKSLEDPLREGLKHEQYVTSLIHNIYDAAHNAKDYRTMKFLDWYVAEQGEEEKNASDLLTQFQLFGSDPKSLYSLNNELSNRTYTPASILSNE